MVRKATSFILAHGPSTDLDRWETTGTEAYSPSTIAIEIAALRTATLLTGDPLPAATADRWQARIESWTLKAESPLGKNYYLRTSSGSQNLPAPDLTKDLTKDLTDGGFLDLVRYGVREPLDSRILNTLKIYDQPASGFAGGKLYRRFALDAATPAQHDGLWPLLAGERGNYAVMAKDFERARAQLHALETAATENGLLPQQAQAGLEVACPFVWAHAEDILLHRSMEEGSVFDQPAAY
jgi:glucoamylase